MPPIRKGDGTAVAPKGISQVRTGDGRILFDGPALPDSVVDDFEQYTPGGSTDLSDNYSGDLSAFDIITDDTLEQDQSLEVNTDGNVMITSSNLETTPSRGDRFSYIVEHRSDNTLFNFRFFVDDGYYSVKTGTRDGFDFDLLKDTGDIDSESFNPTQGQTYEVEIRTDESSIESEIYEFDISSQEREQSVAGPISGTDSDYDSGEIAWREVGDGSNRITTIDRLWILEG